MSCDTYTVYVGTVAAAKGMSIDYAMMLAKAIFSEFWNDASISVTIKKEVTDDA